MKIILSILSLLFSIAMVNAQEWYINFTEAQEASANSNKPIILVFQGSDWCAPCIKLDKEIWSTDEFKSYAKEHYVMLKADFPRKKSNKLSEEQTQANKKLAEKYNKQGYFPFVVVLNSKGDVLGEIGYKKTTPKKYIEEINAFLK
ncbi:MAG: thioredoxin family protein [Winogradskyella sp.]|nr:thioredoxin family protein [Winogradskyella sp.]